MHPVIRAFSLALIPTALLSARDIKGENDAFRPTSPGLPAMVSFALETPAAQGMDEKALLELLQSIVKEGAVQ